MASPCLEEEAPLATLQAADRLLRTPLTGTLQGEVRTGDPSSCAQAWAIPPLLTASQLLP